MPGMPRQRADRSPRLFLALLPDEPTRAALAQHGAQWRWSGRESRYAPADWHITLHFIGAVTPACRDDLRAALDLSLAPVDLPFGQAELWPGGLAVLCPLSVPPPLQQLQARLGQALQRRGLRVDARAWRAHITLARRAQGAQWPLQAPDFVWRVHDCVLMESTGNREPRYRVVPR